MVINNSKGTYSAGGVRVTTQRLIDERGPLVSTANGTDLAVRGSGMLPVTESSALFVGGANDFPLRLASTGSFRTNADGYLMTTSGLVLLGWPADPDGTVPTFPRDTAGGLEPIRINTKQFTSDPTTTIEMAVNLPATATEEDALGDDLELTLEYFDNLGIAESLGVTFTPNIAAAGDPATNEWTLRITDSATGGTLVGEYTLEFDSAHGLGGRLKNVTDTIGGAYEGADGTISISVPGGDIDIMIGQIGEAGGLSQLSDSFAPVSLTKDGSPVGNMTSVEVDANGFVRAFFDNGVSRTIYQVPLVDVSNPNGLATRDQQSYSVTPESGAFFLIEAGDGPSGDIASFAREESATDVAGELTQLIQTQRAYSSNAKVIQTVDEMLPKSCRRTWRTL